jgi:hypothetical protein
MSFGASDLLAWIPVLVSVIAILIANRAVTRSLRPVLVFVCEVRDEVWRVQNVGTGPALDVVVAEKDRDEQPWARFKRVPPLPKDGEIRLRSAPIFFAVTYNDVENHGYSTICTGYRNRLQKGHVFDKPDENQIALDSYERSQ